MSKLPSFGNKTATADESNPDPKTEGDAAKAEDAKDGQTTDTVVSADTNANISDAPNRGASAEEAAKIEALVAEQKRADDEPAGRYTSYPTQRLSMADFHFENGLLEIQDSEDNERFQKMLAGMPVSIQCQVKEISVARAEEILKGYAGQGTRMTKGMDTSQPSGDDD